MTTKQDFRLPTLPDSNTAIRLVRNLQSPVKVEIKDEDTFIASWSIIQRHDEIIVKISEMFDPFVDGLHKLHKMAVALRAQFVDPVLESKKLWLERRGVYSRAKEAEAKRLRDETADALRKQQAKDLEKDARKLEKQGETEAAAVVREQAANLPTPSLPIMPATPKQAGSVSVTKWKFEIETPDEVPREFCDPNPTKVRKVVEALGDKCKIPGVRVWQETAEHSRAVRP
jgi:predicted RNA-binding protein with RPS1 domain